VASIATDRAGILENQDKRSLQLALAAARAAEDNRGTDVVVLDLREITPIFDYFVVATGTSGKQMRAMASAIDDVLEKELGDRRLGIEGFDDTGWILLDYGNVVIHLFSEAKREYYDLERLWDGAPQVPRVRRLPR